VQPQGMITLWDVEGGLPQLDKYLYSNDQAVVAGALLGVGIVNANVRVRHSAQGPLSYSAPNLATAAAASPHE
jgi:hypothetical protein